MKGFVEQLREDVARVIATEGNVQKWGVNRIRLEMDSYGYEPEEVYWKVVKGIATRTVWLLEDGIQRKTETTYDQPTFDLGIQNATELMREIKRMLNPIREAKKLDKDIPF